MIPDSTKGMKPTGVGFLAMDESHGGDGIVVTNDINEIRDFKGKKVVLFFKNDYYRCTILLFQVLDILFIYKALTLFIIGLNSIKSIYAKGKS